MIRAHHNPTHGSLIPDPSPEGRREFEPLSLRERGRGEGNLLQRINGTRHQRFISGARDLTLTGESMFGPRSCPQYSDYFACAGSSDAVSSVKSAMAASKSCVTAAPLALALCTTSVWAINS